MNLVDSCGWVEYFADGPNAASFADALEDLPNVLVPTICILEVFKCAVRQRGEQDALESIAVMRRAHVADLDESIAMAAAKLGLDTGLPLADSIILATARAHRATLWTQDADFEGMDGVKYVAKA